MMYKVVFDFFFFLEDARLVGVRLTVAGLRLTAFMGFEFDLATG